jgi:hypothetical protein
MNTRVSNQLRWSHISALAGSLAWLILLFLLPPEPETLALITRLLLLAVLVFAPLALGLVIAGSSVWATPLMRLAQRAQPTAAFAVAAAFVLPAGALAGALASSWLAFGGIVALLGLARLFDRSMRDAPELCITMGLLLLPVGGFWLATARLGARPLGFGDTIVLLTAVHFHYAGFALLILAGLAGRRLRMGAPLGRGLFRLVALGIIAGVPLVALGITFSRTLEILAVLLLVASVLALAILTLIAVVPRVERRGAQALLAISALASVATMLLAAGYAAGGPLGLALTIPQMVVAHGLVNAFGLALCGLLAWSLEESKATL